MSPFVLHKTADSTSPAQLLEFLAVHSRLSKTKLKQALNNGAVWLKTRGREKRCRRATETVHAGQHVSLYYDEELLGRKPPIPDLVKDLHAYSVWIKPAGLLSQGTRYGDHCSLLRQVELYYRKKRQVFLVHRLDREASGLMLVAHNRKTAQSLSTMFKERKIQKRYRVEVKGDLRSYSPKTIEFPLDGKSAKTVLEATVYAADTDISTAIVSISTGRKHQIRRHFESIGYPVVGDSCYGVGNKTESGLRLWAIELSFLCPVTNKMVRFTAYSEED